MKKLLHLRADGKTIPSCELRLLCTKLLFAFFEQRDEFFIHPNQPESDRMSGLPSLTKRTVPKRGRFKMYCPFCSNEDTKVLESRIIDNSVRRRRECANCNNRFTTYEKFIFSLMVEKKDGREEEFQREKIKNSLIKACSKTLPEAIEEITKRIEQRIINQKTNKISTSKIGKIVLQELRKSDKVAYLRFASVHKSFDNPEMFKKELNLLIKP